MQPHALLIWASTNFMGPLGFTALFMVSKNHIVSPVNYCNNFILFQAVFEILLLDTSVAMTLFAFWKVDTLAGMLLLPYVAWLSLATALTIAIWKANKKWRLGPNTKKK